MDPGPKYEDDWCPTCNGYGTVLLHHGYFSDETACTGAEYFPSDGTYQLVTVVDRTQVIKCSRCRGTGLVNEGKKRRRTSLLRGRA